MVNPLKEPMFDSQEQYLWLGYALVYVSGKPVKDLVENLNLVSHPPDEVPTGI